MNKPNLEISRRFPEYTVLMDVLKTIRVSPVVIKSPVRSSRQDYLESRVPLEHPEINEPILFFPKVKDNEARKFHFGVQVDSFCPNPCFRFDSDGPAHKNDIEGVPLAERQITTPHFHKFTANGIEVAYKTPQLLDPVIVETLLDDVNLGLAHFCHEAQIRLPDGKFPEVAKETESTIRDEGYTDPLSGVSFN
jgi:hypothetical protein